jgi:AcrR family transcriptional regulator
MKTKTKDRILATSLHLFNEQGVDTLTVRDIAKEVGISHGNLCYHFANVEEIVFRLYENLVEELDVVIEEVQSSDITLTTLYQSTQYIFAKFYKYKFLMLDFVSIMRKMPPIQAHYQQLMVLRRQQFGLMIQNLIENGVFKPEAFENQYTYVITLYTIVADFWIGHAEVFLQTANDEEKLYHYLKVYFYSATAFLTEKGWGEFHQLFSVR